VTTTREVAFPEMTEEQRRVFRAGEALHRDGASPAGALELLAAIVADRTWERLTDKSGRSFAGRFREFVEAKPPYGLGYDPDQLPKVISLRHPHENVPRIADQMAEMREAVRKLLLAEIEPAVNSGGDRRSERFQKRTTLLKSETAERHLRRLKRDDPVLAEKVVNGEMSAYAAARAKGWKPPRIQVTTPERTARHLRKYMTRDQLAELARLLLEGDD